MSPLSFRNGGTDRNADCCVNIDNKKLTTATNLVNFGPVSSEIFCMDDVRWFLKVIR